MTNDKKTLIGYMLPFITKSGFIVWCKECVVGQMTYKVLARTPTPLYKEDTIPYGQHCHLCEKELLKAELLDCQELYPRIIPQLPQDTKVDLFFNLDDDTLIS